MPQTISDRYTIEETIEEAHQFFKASNPPTRSKLQQEQRTAIPPEVLVELKNAKEFAEKLEIRPYNEVYETLQAAVDKTEAKIMKSLEQMFPAIKG
ncbi:MAG: hypothetical protein FWC89_08425 [Defluviitaleaceae bacterium]|nr:hypothetical protein [Defluviitaleaceae bacterium]